LMRILLRAVPTCAATLLILLVCGCTQDDSNQQVIDQPQTIPAVEVVAAREGVLPLVHEATGTVMAAGQVTIFPDTSGPVAEVRVRNGDAVERGDVLVRIQTAGSAAQLQQARSNLAVAEAEVREIEASLGNIRTQFDRARQLGERGIVSRQEVDGWRAQVEATQASLARARAQVAASRAAVSERADIQRQAVVRSPISGRVGQRNVEVGMRVDPSTPLFVVGRLDEMRVDVPVTQEILTDLQVGQRVEIRPGGTEPIPAEISRISPFLEPGSFSAEIEIDVPNDGSLVPGMFVAVDLFYGESRPATLVPTSALYVDPQTGEQGVFVVNDVARVDDDGGQLSSEPAAFTFQPVEVFADGQQTAGVDGVNEGQWVVVIGQHLLAEQGADGTAQARVRAAPWDEILALQSLQREDMLLQFMERQRQLSRTTETTGGR
jgi:RND family efflux transporter MFP subunit